MALSRTGLLIVMPGIAVLVVLQNTGGVRSMPPEIGFYAVFLVLGVAAISIDGQFIRRSGETYLEDVYPNPKVADSLNRLIVVLFHLAMLGVLALISVSGGTNGGSAEDLLSRLGVMLLVMAVAHGITVWVFARVRGSWREQRLQEEIAIRTEAGSEDSGFRPVPRPTARK
jgi:hypothetical protein